MNRYVAFLRAVNVGGRRVKMDELRAWFSQAGYNDVSTYIQSGNVVFTDNGVNISEMEIDIATMLEAHLGFDVATFIYTPTQLKHLIEGCPYKVVPDHMALHVSLLSHIPQDALIHTLHAFQNDNEQYYIAGRVAYIMVLRGKYGETKFSNTFLEKKLKLQATTRNWATISKLAQL